MLPPGFDPASRSAPLLVAVAVVLLGALTPAAPAAPSEGCAGDCAEAASPDHEADDAAQDAAAEAEDAEDAPVEGEGTADEGESHEPAAAPSEGHRYTADISDAEFERRWKEDPASLGPMSVGFADAGRLINAVPCPQGEAWQVVSPWHCWATQETIDFVMSAIATVAAEHPGTLPLRVNHLSSKDGGWLRPHQSHQSGRDVDLAFYYKDGDKGWGRRREKQIDPVRNWTLIRALVTQTDLQVVLVDRRISKVIYEHALSIGEDKDWLDRIFRAGKDSLVKHARRHHDHFHVRFFNPRAQELGRRVVPLLALQPEHNVLQHRVRRGETLGHIARRYGATIKAIQKKNGMRNSFLRVGRVLTIPLRKPCTKCPLPPEVVVPDRCLPPAQVVVEAEAPQVEMPAVEEAPSEAVVANPE